MKRQKTSVCVEAKRMRPGWVRECLHTCEFFHLHLNLKGKECCSPNPHLSIFFPMKVRNTPMSFTRTPAVEKHIYLLWSGWAVAMLRIFPFLDAFKLCLCCCFLPLPPLPRRLLMLSFHPFLFPSFPIEPPASGPSDLNLSSAHIKAMGELQRPPLHPCRPLSLLLLLPPSHPPVKLQTPLSCHHLFFFLHFSACECYVIDHYRLHHSLMSLLQPVWNFNSECIAFKSQNSLLCCCKVLVLHI